MEIKTEDFYKRSTYIIEKEEFEQRRLDTHIQKVASDVEETYFKYMYKYGTENIIVVADDFKEGVYKSGHNTIKVVRSSKLTDLLTGKKILSIINDPVTDKTEITFEGGSVTQWISVESREAEKIGLKQKTKRLHKKPNSQIQKENFIITAAELIKIILPLILTIYAINTKNIIGTGVMLGVTIVFTLQMILDKQKANPYEKRL